MKGSAQKFVLKPGQVDLWFALPANPEVRKLTDSYESLLSPAERLHYEQLQLPEHRQEYLVGRALLRSTLSRYSGIAPREWDFARNRFGKPELTGEAGRAIHFNVAHTCGLAVCAVSLADKVGVDVEFHANSRALVEAAGDYFSDIELADLRARPVELQDEYFFRYWTLKEAFLKARGEGLSIALDSFSFRFDGDAVQFIPAASETDAGASWSFRLLCPSADYTAAVAVTGAVEEFNVYEAVPLVSARCLDSAESLFEHSRQDAYRTGIC